MTKSEIMKAFEMRLDGAGWSDIGRALCYSATTIQENLLGCVMAKQRHATCAYPAIRNVIQEQYGGSLGAFADACGVSYGCMYYMLSGKRVVPEKRQALISSVIGIPPEEAFRREDT